MTAKPENPPALLPWQRAERHASWVAKHRGRKPVQPLLKDAWLAGSEACARLGFNDASDRLVKAIRSVTGEDQ